MRLHQGARQAGRFGLDRATEKLPVRLLGVLRAQQAHLRALQPGGVAQLLQAGFGRRLVVVDARHLRERAFAEHPL